MGKCFEVTNAPAQSFCATDDYMRVIALPSFGIVVTLGREDGESTPRASTIESDLHGSDETAEEKAAIDAIESMILAHAAAGVDIESPAYMEGIETAFDAVSNHASGIDAGEDAKDAALRKCVDALKAELKEIGPCDHSVGVCVCPVIEAIAQAERALGVPQPPDYDPEPDTPAPR